MRGGVGIHQASSTQRPPPKTLSPCHSLIHHTPKNINNKIKTQGTEAGPAMSWDLCRPKLRPATAAGGTPWWAGGFAACSGWSADGSNLSRNGFGGPLAVGRQHMVDDQGWAWAASWLASFPMRQNALRVGAPKHAPSRPRQACPLFKAAAPPNTQVSPLFRSCRYIIIH